MNQSITLKEYWNFIKSYKRTIIATIVTIVVLVMGFTIANNYFTDESKISESKIEEVPDGPVIDEEQAREYLTSEFNLLTENQQAELVNYLNQDAYIFRYYLEDEDAEPYTSFRTVKEILTADNLVQEIENKTSVNLLPDAKRAIRLDYDGNNFIQTFLVGMGDEDGNLKLAQEYYKIFEEESLPFFDNKNVYLIDDSPIRFEDIEAEEEIVPNELEAETPSQSTNVIIFILSIVLAVIVGIMISFFQNYLKKEISYLYNYQLLNNEVLIKLNQTKDNSKSTRLNLVNHIVRNSSLDKLVVIGEGVPTEYHELFKENDNTGRVIKTVSDILNLPPNSDVQEIYIFVALNETNKSWYNQQLELSRNYQSRLTVIEID